MSSKHRITINLNEEEFFFFQNIATKMDRSLSWLGRKAICDFIDQKKKDKNSFPVETPPQIFKVDRK